MAKLKYDVSGVDPSESAGGAFEDPKPGVYRAVVKEINSGFSKGDSGKPDKARPRLEVIYSLLDEPYKGSRLWDYISLTESSTWKLDQFLLAVGVSQKKRKGEVDTDELVNMPVKVRVKADSQMIDGTAVYRAKVGSIMAGEDSDLDDIEDLDDLEDLEEEEIEEEDIEEEDEEDEEEGYTEEALAELPLSGLSKILIDEFGLAKADIPKGRQPKVDLILSGGAEEEEEEEEEEDEDVDLSSMTIADLRAKAKELEIPHTGKKADLIAAIEEALEEEPF